MADVVFVKFNNWEASAIYEDGQLVAEKDISLETAFRIYRFQQANIKWFVCKPNNEEDVYNVWINLPLNGWPKVIDTIPLNKFIELVLP